MKVLSLFDGISCARESLKRARVKVDEYYASEIDPSAIQISQKNWPDIKHIGDIKNINKKSFPFLFDGSVDLVIGGSPCQDLSIANIKRKGLDGKRSGLFYEFLRLIKEIKPKYFVLENVASMSKESRDIISRELGVEPIMIDASLVSAQLRRKYFWSNIENISLPEDRNILLKDVLENGIVDRDKSYCIDFSYYKGGNLENYLNKGRRQLVFVKGKKPYVVVPEATKRGIALAYEGQSIDVSFLGSKTRRGRVGDKAKNLMTAKTIGVVTKYGVRLLTPIECERLQSLPDNYTEGVSNTQRYKAVGNAFNVEVVRHILKNIK